MTDEVTTTPAREPCPGYSHELFSRICERIACGVSFNSISKSNGMPSRTTFYRWVASDPELEAEYRLALDMRADHYSDEILVIADDDSEDELFIEADDHSGKSAKRVANNEFINRSRLRVDARKWLASKLAPKKYGDKIEIEHSASKTFDPAAAIAGFLTIPVNPSPDDPR